MVSHRNHTRSPPAGYFCYSQGMRFERIARSRGSRYMRSLLRFAICVVAIAGICLSLPPLKSSMISPVVVESEILIPDSAGFNENIQRDSQSAATHSQSIEASSATVYYAGSYWNDFNLVQKYLNSRATGSEDVPWMEHLFNKFHRKPFEKALILSSGNGWVERELFAGSIIKSAVGLISTTIAQSYSG